ncbi:hypothetical protein DP140_27170, partial [Salmonella enterica subsp. enterica serovar Weltevreden]
IVMIPPLNRYVPALSKNELVKTVTNRDIQFTSFNGKDYPLCFNDIVKVGVFLCVNYRYIIFPKASRIPLKPLEKKRGFLI